MTECDVCDLPIELCVCDDLEESTASLSPAQELVVGPLDESEEYAVVVWGFEERGLLSAVEIARRVGQGFGQQDGVTVDVNDEHERLLLAGTDADTVESQLRTETPCTVADSAGVPQVHPYGVLVTTDEDGVSLEGKIWPRPVPDDRAEDGTGGDAGGGRTVPTWTVETGAQLAAPPAVDASMCYTGGYDGCVTALEAGDGSVSWEAEVGGEIVRSQPVVRDGTVYVTSYDDLGRDDETVAALDSADGSVQWTASTYRGSEYSPVVTDAGVLVGGTGRPSEPGPLRCLDRADGSERWQRAVGPSRLAVADETVYVLTGARLDALDLADGTERWTQEFGTTLGPEPVTHQGTVFVGTGNNDVHAVDGSTGEVVWSRDVYVEPVHSARRNARTQTHPLAFTGITALAVADESLFVGTYNAVFALDIQQGGIHWAVDLDCASVTTLDRVDDRLYVGTGSGTIYSLAPSDGAGGPVVEFDETVYPTVSGDALYVTTDSGTVHGVTSR